LTKGIPITKLPSAFLFFGRSDVDRLNPPLWLAFGLLMLLAPLLFRTKWGQYVMALGGNEEALRRQGVATDRYRMYAHMMAGFTAAVTGLIITARLNSAEANAGLGMEVDAITAVILGGTSLSGGRASLFGTSVAVILLGSIRNALTILSISSYYQQFVMGLLLLLSVLLAKWREQT
jgi:ribose/xylose/arabinose/galactoside ABC-type transport system permease subunit